jgi:predicted O-methyltransferase YrrM
VGFKIVITLITAISIFVCISGQSPIENDIQKIMSIEGSVSKTEVRLLYTYAKNVKENCIVEIGSARGRSTAALALGSLAGSKVPVYAIEPHEEFIGVKGGKFGPQDRVEFFKNMLRVGCVEIVRLINLQSQEVAPGWTQSIGFLWIDGDHSYEAVKHDSEAFRAFLVPGGFVALHDSKLEGPARVIAEAIASGRYRRVRKVGQITLLKLKQ